MFDAMLNSLSPEAELLWGLSVGQSNTFLLIFMLCTLVLAIAFGSLVFRYENLRQATKAAQLQHHQELKTYAKRTDEVQSKLIGERQKVEEMLQTTQREKADLETQVEALKQQCSRLRDDLETQAQQVQQDTQAIAFQQIQTLLTQHPTVRCMAETKPELPARNVVALFTSLDNLVKFWGYEAIGEPWAELAYDPQLHQADAAEIEPGETVYVRFVGYRDPKSDQILMPAKVSRTLPAGATQHSP